MASKRMLVTIALVALAISPVLAKEYVVGDDKGWTSVDPNYEAWVAGKKFHVGDKLVFKYKFGFHNVVKVDEASFKNCVAPKTAAPLESGNDVITLEKPGKEWYICSVGKHCELKQKLAITVLPQNEEAVAPKDKAPAPSPPQNGTAVPPKDKAPAPSPPKNGTAVAPKDKAPAPSPPQNGTAVPPKDKAAAPSPPEDKSAASGLIASKLYICMAVAFGFLARIMV